MGAKRNERVCHRIALILLECDPSHIGFLGNEAVDMAERGARGWWELVGRPDYTRRLQALKRAWAKQTKRGKK